MQIELAEKNHNRFTHGSNRSEQNKRMSRKKKILTLNVIKKFTCRPEIGLKHFDKLKPVPGATYNSGNNRRWCQPQQRLIWRRKKISNARALAHEVELTSTTILLRHEQTHFYFDCINTGTSTALGFPHGRGRNQLLFIGGQNGCNSLLCPTNNETRFWKFRGEGNCPVAHLAAGLPRPQSTHCGVTRGAIWPYYSPRRITSWRAGSHDRRHLAKVGRGREDRWLGLAVVSVQLGTCEWFNGYSWVPHVDQKALTVCWPM